MLANYVTVPYATRLSLGNTDPYAAAVLADWVGMLTGTITAVSGLSAYADKTSCTMQGAAGDWTVYDNNAHFSFSGVAKVLRRLNNDGVTYQYMWIGFRSAAADALNGMISFMGGWDSANKVCLTQASTIASSGASVLASGTIFNSANISLATVASATGTSSSFLFNTAGGFIYPHPLQNTIDAWTMCNLGRNHVCHGDFPSHNYGRAR